MTLHYAPQTAEEEELALALAISASLHTGPSSSASGRQGRSTTSAPTATSSHPAPSRAGAAQAPLSSGPSGAGARSVAGPPPPGPLIPLPQASLYPPIYPAAPPPAPAPHLIPLGGGSSAPARQQPHPHAQAHTNAPGSLAYPGGWGQGSYPTGPVPGPTGGHQPRPGASGAATASGPGRGWGAGAAGSSSGSPGRPGRSGGSLPGPSHPPRHPQPPPQQPVSTSSGSGSGKGSTGQRPPQLPPAAQPQRPQPALFPDPAACAGCGRGFGLFSPSYITALGRKWHPGCFKCGFCSDPIGGGAGGATFHTHPGDPLPYHPDCYRHAHHPACHVCGDYIPADESGRIAWRESGFWRERYCPGHAEAELVKCCACSRLQRRGEEWAPLPDGRPLCLSCLGSVVLDTREAQPLYDELLEWYRGEMGLPLPYKPPLLLVDGPTLASHASAEGRDDSGAAPVFHVRGLCVATVYSHIPSILRALGGGGGVRSVATPLGPTATQHPGVRCEVTCLLLLYGLPRLLAGSILAHEAMHAHLRMAGCVGLALRTEEGLCQLMAALWLDRQHGRLEGDPEQQRLASFLAWQVRTDTSEVYGEGFREAMEAFQSLGLRALVDNVKRYGAYMPPRH